MLPSQFPNSLIANSLCKWGSIIPSQLPNDSQLMQMLTLLERFINSPLTTERSIRRLCSGRSRGWLRPVLPACSKLHPKQYPLWWVNLGILGKGLWGADHWYAFPFSHLLTISADKSPLNQLSVKNVFLLLIIKTFHHQHHYIFHVKKRQLFGVFESRKWVSARCYPSLSADHHGMCSRSWKCGLNSSKSASESCFLMKI